MFAPLLIAASLVSVPPVEPLPTAAELAAGLAEARAAVREAHVVFADRTVTYPNPGAAGVPQGGRWFEAFLKGDAAQVRMDWGTAPAGGWFAGTPAGVPLTGDSAANYPGHLICLRSPGDALSEEGAPDAGAVRSQLLSWVIPGQSGMLSDRLFTLYADVEHLSLPVPHVAAGRSWSVDGMSASLLDRFAETDPAAWTVEGRETKDGRPAVRVFAAAHEPVMVPSEKYGGTLEIAGGLRAWFTDDIHRDLFRVERVHLLRYDGEEIPQPRANGLAPGPFAVARDFRPLPGGVRVPFAGTETFVAVAVAPTGPGEATGGEQASEWAGADPLIEEFLGAGQIVDPAEVTYVASETEWRIETLEPLDPAVTAADLWVAPPDGAQVNDTVAGEERIAGTNWFHSWLIVTFRSRNAAWWTLGPPSALCALAALGLWWRRRRRRWATA